MTSLASRAQLRASFLRYALFTVPGLVLLGSISGRIANSGYDNPWFDALEKPAAMPPGAVFGIVWTLLYILLGFVLALLLHAKGARRRGQMIGLFALQMGLNYAWSPVFFAMHRIDWALTMIAAMIVLSIALAALCWPIRRVPALMLLPYIAWLGFAAWLTLGIAGLNPEALAPPPSATNIEL